MYIALVPYKAFFRGTWSSLIYDVVYNFIEKYEFIQQGESLKYLAIRKTKREITVILNFDIFMKLMSDLKKTLFTCCKKIWIKRAQRHNGSQK